MILSDLSFNVESIQRHRCQQISRWLSEVDCEALLLTDPVNIRYATGTRNMQVWTMHNLLRYALVFAEGKPVLFESPSSAHLSSGLVDDVRPALTTDFMAVGHRGEEMALRAASKPSVVMS